MAHAYLISRPGRPLHLAVVSHTASGWLNQWQPICGQNYDGQRWQFVTTRDPRWERLSGAGVCASCRTVAGQLLAAADHATALRSTIALPGLG